MKIKWMLLSTSADKFQWVITDESGNRYYFGRASVGDVSQTSCETSVNKTITYSTANGGRTESRGDAMQKLYPSSWYLKQVVLNNGEFINFQYTDYTTNLCGLSNENNIFGFGDEGCGILSVNKTTINKTVVSGKKISSIEFNNGKVTFTYSLENRKDLINSNDNYLDKVTLLTSSDEVIKYFTLKHSYFNLAGINRQFLWIAQFQKKEN